MTRAVWDLSQGDCLALAEELGQPNFRGRQLYDAIVTGTPIERASNLPKPFREKIAERFDTATAEIAEILTGKDGTEKLLYRLRDGNVVEGVLMRYRYGNTLCISTQVGCRMNCAFCASGLDGLVRNLTAGEMLGEVASVNRKENAGRGGDRAVTNLVLMGSGEPLDNYDETLKFLRLVSSAEGFGISPRNISLSTCGLVPEIDRLSEEGLPLNLTISLHAADDARRERLMPIDKRYPIAEVLAAAKRYFDKTGRRIHIEYSLIDGENAGGDSARLLVKRLAGLNCHVNLIRLNPVKERGKRPASKNAVERFLGVLETNGIPVTIRRSMGADIEGACGQLRRRFLAEGSGKIAGNAVASGKMEIAETTDFAGFGENAQNAEAADKTGDAETTDFAGFGEKAEKAEIADKTGDAEFGGKAETTDFAGFGEDAQNAKAADKTGDAEFGGNAETAGFGEKAEKAEIADKTGNAEFGGNVEIAGRAKAAFSVHAERVRTSGSASTDFSDTETRGSAAGAPANGRCLPREGSAETGVDCETPKRRSKARRPNAPQYFGEAPGGSETPNAPNDSETTAVDPLARQGAGNPVGSETPNGSETIVGNRNAPQGNSGGNQKTPRGSGEGAE